jgi:uncharacterized membrane protein
LSETAPAVEIAPGEYRAAQNEVINLYLATVVLCLIAIGILVAYCISLGSLVGPGVESSLGYALALLFLISALLVHIVDRSYREWPLGRRIHPPAPTIITAGTMVYVLKIVVVAGIAALIAYILATLLTS